MRLLKRIELDGVVTPRRFSDYSPAVLVGEDGRFDPNELLEEYPYGKILKVTITVEEEVESELSD